MPTLVMISKKAHEGLTPRETWLRRIFVVGYAVLTILMFVNLEFELAGSTFTAPRLFWTVGLPLLPIGIVIAGFYPWRKVCPLAFWGEQGRRLDRMVRAKSDAKPEDAVATGKAAAKAAAKAAKAKPGPQRRMPKWAEAWYPMIALGVLWFCLAGRLLLTNGDGIALGILLVALGLTAALVNWRYTGKTWCNFICPVSIVERIYTEPNSLRLEHNSQCSTCTACKKNCPDIDQENSYWKDVEERAKRMAYYAFPGLVLGFYTYFWLRAGDWTAYFDGSWTHQAVTRELVLGPGLFFAPWLPAVVAAPLSLAVFMLTSFLIFAGLERGLARVWDEELRRHRVFTLAAFAAFNLFYLFAGAPTLRKLEYGPRVLAFAVPLVATMFLVKRWKRSRKDFVEERTAKQLLKKWKFKDAPPDDPAGVFAYLKAKESSEEQQLAVYRESLRQAWSDGQVTKSEQQLLELLRSQLGISDGQHRKIIEELRTDTTQVLSVERELQLEGYRRALTEAMLGNAGEHEFRRLRREYNIDKPTHERIATELRGEHSPMLERVREGVARIAELRRNYLIPLAPLRASGTFELALFVLERMQQRELERVLEALPLTVGKGSDAEQVRVAANALSQPDAERREQALHELAGKIGDDVHSALAEVVREPQPRPVGSEAPNEPAFHATIDRMLAHGDPYLRAGAIQAIGHLQLQTFSAKLAGLLADEEPLVRETVIYASLRAPTLLQPAQLEVLLRDEEPQIRRAAREVLEALAAPATIAKANPIRVVEGRTLPPIPDDVFSSLATGDKLLFLRCVPLFQELDPEDLHEICQIARERTIAAEGTICQQGDASDDLYVLISGSAAVTVGDNREVATIGAGDVVGELAAIDQSPRSATVRPKDGPVRLLEIRGNDFRKRIIQRKDVAPKLMATLSRRLRETLARVR